MNTPNGVGPWSLVKVKNPEHPRANQAGTTTTRDSIPDLADDHAAVRFDIDQAVEAVAVADLDTLSSGK